ncbi:sensor histidine kinase [Saccharospirillum mangrovi]|uniref:sensor histidine kinase n=1 Tax=Saccharospirillum mangrovi TaxID=2161747 RepID=UPI000D3C1749|nr:sensor histidine kinase [Saccharospirillum mangrovi]
MAHSNPSLLGRLLAWLLGTTAASSAAIGVVVVSGRHLDPVLVIGLITLISVGASAVLLQIVRRYFLSPLLDLMHVSNRVTQTDDIKLRAPKYKSDELGRVVDAFNAMLDRIEKREAELTAERDRVTQALQQSEAMTAEAQRTTHKLEFEVQVRQRIERKLTDFQNYLNAIINSMPSALIAIDEHLLVTQWNQEASRLSGTRADQALGLSLADAFPLLGEHHDLVQQALSEHSLKSRHNLILTLPDEQRVRLNLVVYPLQQTEAHGAVIRLDDITEQFRLEEVMVQTEKMMSVGGLAAGMAHEINNPLGAIVQNAQNVQRRLDPKLKRNRETAAELQLDLQRFQSYLEARKVPHFLDNITESGLRASRIVTNMLQFSRASGHRLQPYPIGALMEQAINIALNDYNLKAGYADHNLFVDQDFRAPAIEVPCVMAELEQVLLNLLKNAAQAIRERFETLNDIDEGIIQIYQYIDDQDCVIEVSDNGAGMTEATRKRLFEPFFTTKEVGVGTGLGLSVSFFIITAHHYGNLSVDSEPGQGSRFTLRLPLHLPATDADSDTNVSAD